MPLQYHILLAVAALVLIDQIRAATIPLHSSSPPSFPSSSSVAATDSSTCPDGNNCRTMWDIVWSCASTIFLCTWVAFHPPVPDPTFTQMRVTVVRILAVIFSFVAPELVVAAAAADYWEVRRYKSPFQGVLCSTQLISYQQLIGLQDGPKLIHTSRGWADLSAPQMTESWFFMAI